MKDTGKTTQKKKKTGSKRASSAKRKMAKEEIAEHGAMLQQIMDTASVAIFLVDKIGRITHANRRMAEMFGCSMEELVGSEYVDHVHPSERETGRQKMLALLASEIPSVDLERLYWRKDGAEFWGHLAGRRFHDVHGNELGLIGVITDINKRKLAENELREGEQKYRRLYNETPVLLHSIDRDGIVVEVNNYWLKTMGYERSEVIGKKVTDFYTDASRKYAQEVVYPAFFRDGIAKEVSFQFVKKNGDVLDVLLSATAERDAAGIVVRSLAVIVDITEQKRTEDLLRRSEDRYRMLYQGTPVMMHSIDAEGKLVSVSNQWLKQLGYARDEVLGRRSTEFLDEQSRTYARTVVLPDFMRTGICADIPYTFLKKNGESISTLLSAIAERDEAGKVVRSLAVIIDITERKRAEKKLRESEERYRQLFEAESDAILLIDNDTGGILMANNAAQAMYGYSREELLAKKNTDLSAEPSETQRVTEETPIVKENTVTIPLRYHRKKDGTVFPVEITGRFFNYEGCPVHLAAIRDITERKRAEEALKESEARFKAITMTASDAILLMDDRGKIVHWNTAAGRMFGYSAEEALGKDLHLFLAPKRLHKNYLKGFEKFVKTGQGPVINKSVELAAHRKDGTEFPIEVSTSAMNIGGRWHALGIVRDITERKHLEQELLKAQKLESIGTLAGGIAHDFNNLLQGIFGYISMAKLTHDQKEKSLAMLEQAEKALHQSVHLTSQLLTFSKGGKPVKKVLDLRPLIENSAAFALSGSRNTYEIVIDNGLHAIEADEGQIGQVIQNIVLNADQAMPLGGRITIFARNIPASATAGLPNAATGDVVEITIQDQGTGIPAEHLSRIFDPYFTTKEKGSGLGLATAYSIIKNHGGLVRVQSEVGKGATFIIYLPASGAEGEWPKSPVIPAATRKSKILVMDDEEIIRAVAGELLTALGHDVAFAETGEAALDAYRAARHAGRPFDVVILDLTIRGGMGGLETLQKLAEIDPSVKAVVSSGYSDNAVTADYRKQGFTAFLKKPYNVEELQSTLNALLA